MSRKADGDGAQAMFREAVQRMNAGDAPGAEQLCKQVLTAHPDHAGAVHLRGLAEHAQGRSREAGESIRRAVSLNPRAPAFHNNLGEVVRVLEGPGAAVAHYKEALRLAPDFADAHSNLGIALGACGQTGAAREAFARAIEAHPAHVAAFMNLGALELEAGSVEEAVRAYEAVLALDPSIIEARVNLAVALTRLGRAGSARECLVEALRVAPRNLQVLLAMGNACASTGDAAQAEKWFRNATQAAPQSAAAFNNLGNVLRSLGRLAQARDALLEALRLSPDLAEAWNSLGAVYQHFGDVALAVDAWRHALAVDPEFAAAHSNLVYAHCFLPDAAPETVCAVHRAWSQAHESRLAAACEPHANSRDPDKVLRIGYLSPDFRTHSVVYFFEPLLAHHDASQVQAVCYADGGERDATSERLSALAPRWREVGALDDASLARMIREDGIDILVDLAGHTAANRMGVFARKPAPLQVTWLGYPNTTGLDAMDYRITDAWADPPGMTEHLHSEALLRLPCGFVCYRPPLESEPVAPPPLASRGYPVFGSFNHATKINARVARVWAGLMHEVPDARLLLKSSQLRDRVARERIAGLFSAQGIAVRRLEFLGWTPSTREHLALYAEIDLALDTFPYNGTTTTCEALWMGVPVLTLAGRVHAARVGVSLLERIGHPELVALDTDAFIAQGAALVRDAERLGALRGALRGELQRSTLGDAVTFARAFEHALRGIWTGWCARADSAPSSAGRGGC